MSACTFEFARDSPLRTTLVDEATGHAKYQIDTPLRITGSVTRIRKFDLPLQSPLILDGEGVSGSGDDHTDKGKKKGIFKWGIFGAELPETSDEIARIHWRCFSSDRITFRGKATTRREFLPKCGKMRGSYKFTGPDGVEYRWAMGAMGTNSPRLVTTDGEKTVVAKFHRASYFRKKQKARLEVQPAGIDMLDYIVLTFVFAESKRRGRERGAQSGG